MSGISLPPIRGALSVPPTFHQSSSVLESRPDSRSSNDTSTSLSTTLPAMFYDNCAFQTSRSINTPRSFTKLPSLRGASRGTRAHSEIHTKYSAKYRSTPDLRTRLSANSPFLPKATSEDCLKCLLKIPHKKCESHKYIRVGGGYRHGYWYVKCLLEELELQRQRELIAKQRLEAIKEKQMKAIKTYIRTKSGRLIERIVFLSEEDYEAFKAGKGAEILKKYLTKEEAEGLESWDKDEVKAIKTLVRTKSGRLIEKIVYVSKEDYDAITQGKVDAKELLKKYYKPAEGETIEGWDEAKMKTIKTYVRTKSGRLIEKTIMISQEDYDKMIKEGIKPEDILKKYLPLEEGETIEGWESQEPMKAVTMKVRTKSGRIIEKTIMVRADEYDRLMAGGADANEILGKYLGEEGGTIESWQKAEGKPMKVIKTLVRTKSGRLIEKTVMLTEEEYRQFQEAGGDPEFLKKFMKLEPGEQIEDWEKASTVFEDDNDPELMLAKEGQRIVGKDGTVYEVVVDPLTGKKYKKKVGQESDIDSGIASMQKGKKGKKGKGGADIEETPEERARRKAGKRDPDSDSDYSYKSYVSAGGTRHVQRRRKRADGTYSDPESYHSSQDEDGAARRRRRRREREHQNSAHSYYSVVSEGGTRHVKRRRRREDGTYSDSESYHSADSLKPGGRLAEKKRKEKEAKEKAAKEKAAKEAAAKKGKKKRGGSGSDYSYTSEYSEGGTRKVTRRKKIKDAQGNVIGYGDAESFSESDESAYTEVSDGKGGKILVKKPKLTSKQKAEAKMKAKAEAKAKEAITKIKGGKFADVGDFSDSTVSEDVDLENMTEEEKAAYFKAKAERKAAREARRREKYGDKYDLMLEKQKELKKLKKLEELRAKGLISPSSDWSIDSDTGEPVRKSVKKEAKKQKILQDLREKGLISPSSDWTVDSEGNPVRISELVKQGKRKDKKKDGHEADDESDEKEGKKGKAKKKTTRRKSEVAAAKKAIKEKLKNMTKEEKENYRKGKRDPDSDSDYSYRSVVSAGGTRHVMRRRKRGDGTYSDEESYHSDQDAEGEARRRQRRREREHGSDSEHSYYSVVSEGGTRHVRRRKRHEDGTYSRSESYRSGDDGNGSNGSDDDDDEYGSDVSVHSVISEGGTRRMVQRQRIRDEDGNIIGYGDPAPISDNKLSKLGYPASSMGTKDALEKLQVRRNGEILRERTTDSLSNLRAEGEPLVPNDNMWPGQDVAGKEEKILKEEEDKIPSDFSDATTVDDIDLSKLTPAQRRQYFAEKEKRRKEREKRRREKYGDKYDEIMKKRNAAKYGTAEKPEEKDKLKVPDENRRFSMSRRKSSAASTMSKGGRPRSMVTYDKGPPRDFGQSNKIDNREIGLAHDEWKGKRETDMGKRNRRGSDASEGSDIPPKLHRETTMLKPLPTIPQGKIYDGDDGKSTKTSKTDRSIKFVTDDDESEASAVKADEKQEKGDDDKDKEEPKKGLNDYFEVGKDGKLMLKKKKIDLNNLTADELRALGIDPNLSAKEIAKKLKSMFGKDIEITLGDEVIGTKGIDEYSDDLNDDQLAKDPNLDLDSLTGLRRVNIIMRRGGQTLQKHMEKVISLSRLVDKYAKDLDERDGDIDFLNHYRLVEPSKIETYARAFVVEDADLDTVINSHEARIALDGVPSIQHMTSKQMDYVMKVLKIDEATLITFRMFAVITSLCERVTHMDSLSQRLLEICNLADIERKLDLYKAMFYHNVPSERTSNFITSESLKIELIAGGLNWKQQEYILEKLEPNSWGEVSFLDYMCYIPLFLSMHDNICYNPLDMSNQKYQMPPRARPASVQRDMNPLGCSLTKQSAYWTRKKAMDEIQGSAYNASVQVSKKYMDILDKYSSAKYNRLKKIEDTRTNMFMKEKTRSSSLTSSKTSDMMY